MADAYKVLGLEPDATLEDVKKAYRRLAKLYHPDKNQGNPKTTAFFTNVTNAYDEITSGRYRPLVTTQAEFRYTPPQKSVHHFTITISLRENFTGSRFNVGIGHVKIPLGARPGVETTWELDPGIEIKGTFEFSYDPYYTVDGFNLISTSMIDRKLMRKGEPFALPNHPDPSVGKVRFSKKTRAGDVVTFKGLGLRSVAGDRGDLIINVRFKKLTFIEAVFEHSGFVIILLILINLAYYAKSHNL